MATLTRPKLQRPLSSPILASQVPSPFPIEQLVEYTSDESQQATMLEDESALENLVGPSTDSASGNPNAVALKNVMPSIVHVQRSCLMTLNNLLSEPIDWNPIIPDRRHSLPSRAPGPSLSSSETTATAALQILVNNLRTHASGGEMVEARQSATEIELLRELQNRVESMLPSLPVSDAALARALVTLLSNLHRLSDIPAFAAQPPSYISENDASSTLEDSPVDMYAELTRQLNDLQIQRLSSQAGLLAPGTSPLLAVETALLWSQIDTELERVMAMCKGRTEALPDFDQTYLPPEYDMNDYDEMESLPDYEPRGRVSLEESKAKISPTHLGAGGRQDEKMRLDLEAVAMAIDRLYLVAPQLHNQRVELKSSKLAQMEKARQEGVGVQQASRKGKERDLKDLDNVLELIGKASERSLKNQSVILDGTMKTRLEEARRKDAAKRDAFVAQLAQHSEVGRIHGQDAILPPKEKDPETLLSLPEFMRETVPLAERLKDPEALLSLPEFVKEPIPPHIAIPNIKAPPIPVEKAKKKRQRSLSAPPLAWLRSSSRSSNTSSQNGKTEDASVTGFEVVYVAENHENLHHMLVFFTVTGGKPGAEIVAEIQPSPLGLDEGGDHLIVKSGPYVSLPLLLPAHTTPGKKEVRSQGKHYEIKLSTISPSPPAERSESPTGPLLDASQLELIKPTSFLCASCSLPLIHSSKVETYRDLPSEHWEELVEAWMCHADQRLHDHVVKHGKGGFWPSPGQGLVGGSYILFEELAMNCNNLHLADEPKHDDNWRLARCLCGAIIGRCQEKSMDNAHTTTFRVLKYAVRPVSRTAEPTKIPLSAFVISDMMEFVQAHASYRFVIRDEEQEKPRILIWLFKPKLHLAYTTPVSRAITKSANILAAKVLYKLLKPTEGPIDIKSILNKYPGFPQAEYLSYPMPICRRLAGQLKESNSAYPENLRMMTGLEVGWLQRV